MVSFHSATHEGVRYLSMDVLQYVFQKRLGLVGYWIG
jgi:hypothetical protein